MQSCDPDLRYSNDEMDHRKVNGQETKHKTTLIMANDFAKKHGMQDDVC